MNVENSALDPVPHVNVMEVVAVDVVAAAEVVMIVKIHRLRSALECSTSLLTQLKKIYATFLANLEKLINVIWCTTGHLEILVDLVSFTLI